MNERGNDAFTPKRARVSTFSGKFYFLTANSEDFREQVDTKKDDRRTDNETKLGNRGLSHSCSSRTKDDADRTDDGTNEEEGSHE